MTLLLCGGSLNSSLGQSLRMTLQVCSSLFPLSPHCVCICLYHPVAASKLCDNRDLALFEDWNPPSHQLTEETIRMSFEVEVQLVICN